MARANSSYLPLQCVAVGLSKIWLRPCAEWRILPTYSAIRLQATNEKQLKNRWLSSNAHAHTHTFSNLCEVFAIPRYISLTEWPCEPLVAIFLKTRISILKQVLEIWQRMKKWLFSLHFDNYPSFAVWLSKPFVIAEKRVERRQLIQHRQCILGKQDMHLLVFVPRQLCETHWQPLLGHLCVVLSSHRFVQSPIRTKQHLTEPA